MRAVAVWLLAGTIGAFGSGEVAAQAPTSTPERSRVRTPSTRDVLDRYLKGDYEGALQGQPALPRFVFSDADRWVTSGGATQSDRRTMAAALFALEYSGLRPALLPAMMTWARDLLARQPPRAAEAEWLRAAIALAQGLNRWVFLVDGVARPPGRGKPAAPVGQIRFARLRYPDDPYFQMAEAISVERSVSRPNENQSAPAQSTTGWDNISAQLATGPGADTADRGAALDRAAGLLERLVDHKTLGPEAHLRLGFVRLRQGQFDAALGHFDRAGLTDVKPVRYLGHFLSGWTLNRNGRTDEAIAAYRSALRVAPHAQSASTLLVAVLLQANRLAEAESAADEFLSNDAADDPWRLYFGGDFPAYPGLVRGLRERLQ